MGALSANSAFLGTRAPLGNSRAMPPFYGSDTQAPRERIDETLHPSPARRERIDWGCKAAIQRFKQEPKRNGWR